MCRQHPDTLKVIQLDITSEKDVKTALKSAVDTFGRIDMIINNAGWTVFGEFETLSEELGRKCFETVFWGTMNVYRQAIPMMREQGGGRIITVSSMVGLGSGIPLLSYFAGAKMGE